VDQSVCDPIGLGPSRSDLGALAARLRLNTVKLNTDGTEYGLRRTYRFFCSIVAQATECVHWGRFFGEPTKWA
jgi:hypothetical protein